MNKEIMKTLGFQDNVNLVEEMKCPFCGKDIDVNKFRDKLSLKEYCISGLCQKCQDDVFGK